MEKQVRTFCRICEPNCPMKATVSADEQVITLEPDHEHPQGGIACHKGLSYAEVHHDPDRLNRPLHRTNPDRSGDGEFEQISWDDATHAIADRLKDIIARHGPNSVAVFAGNPGAFNSRGMVYGGAFVRMLGTQMSFSANTQDMSNRMLAAAAIYGTNTVMVPDLQNTRFLLCMGANPRVSKWTLISTPNDSGQSLADIRTRGGKVLFVNPRVTESSTPETGDTLLIKPGADVYFLAALLNEINRLGGLDTQVLERWSTGMEQALEFAARYPADRVSRVTGISPQDIISVARDFMAADGAAIYISLGVNQGRQGVLAAWLADIIVFATGNLGKKGGMYKPTGLVNFHQPLPVNAIKVSTSIGELSYTTPGTVPLPAAALPRLIESGDIKALICLAGNPVMTCGGEELFRHAVGRLELMVAVDIMPNATAAMCDYVLPATDFLERADINLLGSGLQANPYVQYTDAVVTPLHDRRHDYRILLDIAKRMGIYPGEDQDGWAVINQILGKSELSIETLKDLPHQTRVIEEKPYDEVYRKCLKHEDGKVHCYPSEFVKAGLMERCETIFAELDSEPDAALRMISMRTPYMHNSWLANVKKFRRGGQSVNPLHISVEDAKRRNLTNGELVRVFNQYGEIQARLRVDSGLRQGAVAMAHGYGPGRASMRVAEANPGSNVNRLAPNTLDTVEPLSNMSWIGAYPVEVERYPTNDAP